MCWNGVPGLLLALSVWWSASVLLGSKICISVVYRKQSSLEESGPFAEAVESLAQFQRFWFFPCSRQQHMITPGQGAVVRAKGYTSAESKSSFYSI